VNTTLLWDIVPYDGARKCYTTPIRLLKRDIRLVEHWTKYRIVDSSDRFPPCLRLPLSRVCSLEALWRIKNFALDAAKRCVFQFMRYCFICMGLAVGRPSTQGQLYTSPTSINVSTSEPVKVSCHPDAISAAGPVKDQ
jgi:hypothetical protein